MSYFYVSYISNTYIPLDNDFFANLLCLIETEFVTKSNSLTYGNLKEKFFLTTIHTKLLPTITLLLRIVLWGNTPDQTHVWTKNLKSNKNLFHSIICNYTNEPYNTGRKLSISDGKFLALNIV